jgi:hypothetical protein
MSIVRERSPIWSSSLPEREFSNGEWESVRYTEQRQRRQTNDWTRQIVILDVATKVPA